MCIRDRSLIGSRCCQLFLLRSVERATFGTTLGGLSRNSPVSFNVLQDVKNIKNINMYVRFFMSS